MGLGKIISIIRAEVPAGVRAGVRAHKVPIPKKGIGYIAYKTYFSDLNLI